MANTQLAERYARALHMVAASNGEWSQTGRDLRAFNRLLLRESLLRTCWEHPLLALAAKKAILSDLAAGMCKTAVAFLDLLIDQRRERLLPDICPALDAINAESDGVMRAQVWSARPLADADCAVLRERLETCLGRKMVLEVKLDASLMAGLLVRVGDRLLDGSCRGQMERMRTVLAD